MKRFGVLLAWVFVGLMVAGCDSGGIPEGSPTEPTGASSQTDNFKKMMEKAGPKMTKGQGPKKPAPKKQMTTDAPAEAEKKAP